MNNNSNKIKTYFIILCVVIFLPAVLSIFYELRFLFDFIDNSNTNNNSNNNGTSNSYLQYVEENKTIDTRNFNILSSEENKDVENVIMDFAKSSGYKVNIDYAGTLEIMEKLNDSQKYDAIWSANSIWTYMIDSKKVTLSNSKSTSITPIVFGIKKSKATSLGFVDKQVYTKDILDAISSGNLKFAMANPITTNSGASSYLGLLYTFAGNPEVLTEELIQDVNVKYKIKSFFSGLERVSGTEDFLEEMFLNGDYEAVMTYESSIININKQLESQGKEILYVVYPFDGTAISDNPFAYVDNKDEGKKAIFDDIQKYLLSKEGKEKLQSHGRRTWYGGADNGVDKSLFNPEWGIKTKGYISPVKYPTNDVIKAALTLYQTKYRKPIHVVFCLDYSGSMIGDGIEQLKKAMHYILTEESANDYLQFSEEDIIDIVPFSSNVKKKVTTTNGSQTEELIKYIDSFDAYGGTALFDAAIEGVKTLQNEDRNVRNVSVILMTDGEANVGSFGDLQREYNKIGKDIPIFGITFGDASEKELSKIANLTNGKVFDGKKDLVKAFKEVRGYN